MMFPSPESSKLRKYAKFPKVNHISICSPKHLRAMLSGAFLFTPDEKSKNSLWMGGQKGAFFYIHYERCI